MRLLYLLPGVGLSEQEKQRRSTILNRMAATDTTVEVRAVPSGPLAIENACDEYAAMPQVLCFILAHQHEYDAAIIGCAGDVALAGVREQATIPVAGPGEASILLGTLGDKRFSMVTTSAQRAASKRRLVREAGLQEHRLVSSLSVDIPVLEMYKDPQATGNRLAECARAAKAQGADVLILGCLSLAFLDAPVLHKAQQEGGLPLINPLVAAIKMAEALVALRTSSLNS